MARVVLTFTTLHKVLAAESALRAAREHKFNCRPTPTPPGLGNSICGMSIEILETARTDEITQFLNSRDLPPEGVHTLAD